MAVRRLALMHSFNPKSDVWWPPSEIRILKYTAAAFVCSLKLEFRLSLVSEKQSPRGQYCFFNADDAGDAVGTNENSCDARRPYSISRRTLSVDYR